MHVQTLGLPGEAARTRPKGTSKRGGAGAGSTGGSVGILGGGAGGADRYISAFDLSSASFRPGKPLHDRLLSLLEGIGAKGRGDKGGGEEGGERSGGGRGGGREAIMVDLVAAWWGSEGEEDGGSENGGIRSKARENDKGGAQGDGGEGGRDEASAKQENASEKRETNCAAERRARVARATDDKENDGGTEDPRVGDEKHAAQSREEQRQQKQQQQHEQRCRNIEFPSGFLVEKVDITPDIRFVRGVCCPDIDLVGQGLAAPTRDNANTKNRPAYGGAPATDFLAENTHGTNPATVRRALNQEQSSQGPSPPPESAKCLLLLDMFDWLGAASCGLDAQLRREPSPPEPYLSEFETPRHLRYRRHRTVCRARLRGFLPPLTIARCVNAAGAVAEMSAIALATRAEDETIDSGVRSAQIDGCSWGSVTVWPFRDAPLAYPGADVPCAGGTQRGKRGNACGSGGIDGGIDRRIAREWPVGGHGVYTIVACPHATAAAFVSARCPGPGW